MHDNAGRVEAFDHPAADADMEDEYEQCPPTAEDVLPDADISHDADPMHIDTPCPSRDLNLRPEIRAQGVKKRLRSGDAEEASKKAKKAAKPMFSSPREIVELAQRSSATPQPQPLLSGNSAGLSASTSRGPASTAANSKGAGNSAAAVATAAAATAAGLAHGPPTVELQTVGSMGAGQAQGQGQGQGQNSTGKSGGQLGSALTGATFGVQSAWEPSF